MVDLGLIWGYYGALLAIIRDIYGRSMVHLGSIYGRYRVELASMLGHNDKIPGWLGDHLGMKKFAGPLAIGVSEYPDLVSCILLFFDIVRFWRHPDPVSAGAEPASHPRRTG